MENVTAGLVGYVSFQHCSKLWFVAGIFCRTLAFSRPNILFNLPASTLYGIYSIAIFNPAIPALAATKSALNA